MCSSKRYMSKATKMYWRFSKVILNAKLMRHFKLEPVLNSFHSWQDICKLPTSISFNLYNKALCSNIFICIFEQIGNVDPLHFPSVLLPIRYTAHPTYSNIWPTTDVGRMGISSCPSDLFSSFCHMPIAQ